MSDDPPYVEWQRQSDMSDESTTEQADEIKRLRDEVRNLQIRLIDARAEKQILTAALTNSEIRRRLLEPLHASTLDQSIRHSHQPFDDGGSDNERRD